jgi:hypothetical protein
MTTAAAHIMHREYGERTEGFFLYFIYLVANLSALLYKSTHPKMD